MGKLLYAVALGVVGAGIVHITILFLLPVYTNQDAWTRLAQTVTLNEMAVTGEDAGAGRTIGPGNPLFRSAACRFDLSDGVVHVHGDDKVPFWSMSIYDKTGLNIFSFNDRTATEGLLDFAILTPAQMLEIRKALPQKLESSIFVEADVGEGMLVVRAFVPDDSWEDQATAFLDGLACETP